MLVFATDWPHVVAVVALTGFSYKAPAQVQVICFATARNRSTRPVIIVRTVSYTTLQTSEWIALRPIAHPTGIRLGRVVNAVMNQALKLLYIGKTPVIMASQDQVIASSKGIGLSHRSWNLLSILNPHKPSEVIGCSAISMVSESWLWPSYALLYAAIIIRGIGYSLPSLWHWSIVLHGIQQFLDCCLWIGYRSFQLSNFSQQARHTWIAFF